MEINMMRTNSEVISPENYLKLTEFEKNNIESTQIIPPQLGDIDFGKIIVTYRIPIFKKG